MENADKMETSPEQKRRNQIIQYLKKALCCHFFKKKEYLTNNYGSVTCLLAISRLKPCSCSPEHSIHISVVKRRTRILGHLNPPNVKNHLWPAKGGRDRSQTTGTLPGEMTSPSNQPVRNLPDLKSVV